MLPNQKLTETTEEQNRIQEKPEVIGNDKISGMLKSSIKVNPAFLINYIFPLTMLLIIAILIWFFYFLYNNVYLTMAQAGIVSNLKARVISEQLDKNKFDEIIKRLANKNDLSLWDKAGQLKSPFEFGERNLYLSGSDYSVVSSSPPASSLILPETSATQTEKIIASSTPL